MCFHTLHFSLDLIDLRSSFSARLPQRWKAHEGWCVPSTVSGRGVASWSHLPSGSPSTVLKVLAASSETLGHLLTLGQQAIAAIDQILLTTVFVNKVLLEHGLTICSHTIYGFPRGTMAAVGWVLRSPLTPQLHCPDFWP